MGKTFSSEIYPPISSCSIPPLPEARSRHASFVTTGTNQKVTLCGGSLGSSITSSCLVLDIENQRWEEHVIGKMTMSRWYHAAVSVESVGTYLIGGFSTNMKTTTEFLKEGKSEWVSGPTIPAEMDLPCAIRITQLSFLVIHNHDIREYQVDIADPTSLLGWQSANKWPRLQSRRTRNPGCSVINNQVVIAGGWSGSDLRTTEVVNISTRSISSSGDMTSPRAYLQMVTNTLAGSSTVFAFGGWLGGPTLDSVEMFHASNNSWTLAPSKMQQGRAMFGATVIERAILCPT